MFGSFVAIGDSFTEGVGDELDSGRMRGWADLVASALGRARRHPIRYANLAVRGRKLAPILAEQLEPALALEPDLLSINGGGNDLMRPRVSVRWVAETLDAMARRSVDAGCHVLMISGGNPSAHMPLGGLLRRRGDALAAELFSRYPRDGVTLVDNWTDPVLGDARYWSADHIHLNGAGHARVASNALTALGVPVPEEWRIEETAALPPGRRARRDLGYYRTYVVPWVGRRLTGRSSGDGRSAKFPDYREVPGDDGPSSGDRAAPPRTEAS